MLDKGTVIELSVELANQLQEVIDKENKQTGWDRVSEGKKYYFNDSLNATTWNYENDDSTDNKLYSTANYFSSEELAEKIAFKQMLERKLMKFSAEHKGDKIDKTNDDEPKYNIFYYIKDKELRVGSVYNGLYFGEVYFYSEEIAQQAIEEFKDDLIKYFTMDIYHNEDQTISEG